MNEWMNEWMNDMFIYLFSNTIITRYNLVIYKFDITECGNMFFVFEQYGYTIILYILRI